MTALTSKGSDTHTASPGRPARYGRVFAAVIAVALVGYAGVAMAGVSQEELRERERRVALVIGNGRYEHVQEDRSAHKDAEGVGAALERLGFTVTTLMDAGYVDMLWGLQDFATSALSAQTAMVFYAGHGFAADGRNYLVPVDMRPETYEVAVDPDATNRLRLLVTQGNLGLIPVEWLMRSVLGASNLRLVVLDTDVEAPLESSLTTAPSSGLQVEVDQTVVDRTIVALAATVGRLAAMGEGGHSPYTEALLRYLEEPELELGMLFRKVRDDVMRATEGSQKPVVYGLPGRSVYLGSMPNQPPALDSDLQDPTEEQPAQ